MDDETIFCEALEQAHEERAPFIQDTCEGDEQFRRLVALLAAHASNEATDFLEKPAVERIPGLTEDDFDGVLPHLPPPTRPGALGRLDDRYEILQKVGHGGGGVVFQADDNVLPREVAIKILARHGGDGATATAKTIREARTAVKFSHDNVVTIHDVGDSDGFTYLVMDYVPVTLADKLKGRCLPVPEVVRIGTQLASGLAAAHQRGLVHRDIKPANVLLKGEQEQVKITDFGLAGTFDDSVLARGRGGTPGYVSPEQARGEKLDGRSDLFSLGCVLYRMTTGQLPFGEGSQEPLAPVGAVPRPKDIRSLAPHAPRWLCKIIARLLARDPGKRYQTASEVAKALEDGLAWEERRRRRVRAGSTALLALAALCAVCAAAWLLGPWSPFRVSGRIVSPTDGTEVGKQFIVKGTVSRADGGKLYLAVGKQGVLWPKHHPVVVEGGEWEYSLVEDQTPSGEEFSVHLLFLPPEGEEDVRRWEDASKSANPPSYKGIRLSSITGARRLHSVTLKMR